MFSAPSLDLLDKLWYDKFWRRLLSSFSRWSMATLDTKKSADYLNGRATLVNSQDIEKPFF